MNKIVLDRSALDKLDDVKNRVEICDESGRTIGFFQPLAEAALYGDVAVPFTEQELDRFEQEPGGRRLSEILGERLFHADLQGDVQVPR